MLWGIGGSWGEQHGLMQEPHIQGPKCHKTCCCTLSPAASGGAEGSKRQTLWELSLSTSKMGLGRMSHDSRIPK